MVNTWGADSEQLDGLAAALGQAADLLEHHRSTLGSQVHHAPWRGSDSEQFRDDWSRTHDGSLARAVAFLATARTRLLQNAADQRSASAAPGGSLQGSTTILQGSAPNLQGSTAAVQGSAPSSHTASPAHVPPASHAPSGTGPASSKDPAYSVQRFDQYHSSLRNGSTACGVASMAMVLDYWRMKGGGHVSPLDVERDSHLTNASDGDWMKWPSRFSVGGEQFQLSQVRNPAPADVGGMIDRDLAHGPVIVHMNVNEPGYHGPHYVVITGGDSKHGFTIQDPAHSDRHSLGAPGSPYHLDWVTQVVSIHPAG